MLTKPKNNTILIAIFYTIIICALSYRYVEKNGPDVYLAVTIFLITLVIFFVYFYYKTKKLLKGLVYSLITTLTVTFTVVIVIPSLAVLIWMSTQGKKR